MTKARLVQRVQHVVVACLTFALVSSAGARGNQGVREVRSDQLQAVLSTQLVEVTMRDGAVHRGKVVEVSVAALTVQAPRTDATSPQRLTLENSAILQIRIEKRSRAASVGGGILGGVVGYGLGAVSAQGARTNAGVVGFVLGGLVVGAVVGAKLFGRASRRWDIVKVIPATLSP